MTAATGGLANQYDLLLFDLDGVVYVGEEAVPRAAESIEHLRRQGVRMCYVTNNASRSAQAVARLLTGLGVPAAAEEVLTSAQVSAQLLAERFPPGAPVLVVGSPALAEEVLARHLVPVSAAADRPVAVVQGYGPDVGWRQLAEATRALAAGALWVATNTDRTLPSVRGPLPGNGALVAALSVASGKEPDVVVGKPAPELFVRTAHRYRAQRPLVVGDRLDTDIEGAVRAGYDSVFVLTGTGTAAELLTAGAVERPTYLAVDLADLLRPYPDLVRLDDGVRCRRWEVFPEGKDRLRLSGAGEPVDALRAVCAAAWSRPAQRRVAGIVAATRRAGDVLDELGLPTG